MVFCDQAFELSNIDKVNLKKKLIYLLSIQPDSFKVLDITIQTGFMTLYASLTKKIIKNMIDNDN